jgi:hypothetical protein
MIQNFTKHLLVLLFICLIGNKEGYSQNSVLINFGSATCNDISFPTYSFIKDPQGATPTVISTCDMTDQLGDMFGVFIAYNPKDNKIYVSDVKSGLGTKVWIMDMGLPFNISCPFIPIAPNYSYSYTSNNFEFDNNGDLWSLANYDGITGTANIDQIDVTDGTIISSRQVQFPVGNFPTTISSGDITILPNGRLFATLGSFPSQLYEITNYRSASPATATFLQYIPLDTYGIAYLNGQLEITGTDFGGYCYYYTYDISSHILSIDKPFQSGQLPIDNTSITPTIGTTKQLISSSIVNSNTADLVYEVYVKNMGNTIMNNINVTDDLGSAFGAANVSNVTTNFTANAAGLTLNPAYNGTTVTSLLNTGQLLPNQTLSNTDYFFKIQVHCRVTNLNSGTTYYNSAIGTGNIGDEAALINIADSSNNGTSAVTDPNNNGNPTEVGENIPTPYIFNVIPIDFISVNASLISRSSSVVKWIVATPILNAAKFNVEFSTDGRSWTTLGQVNITNVHQGNYTFPHQSIPTGYLYYRIKEIDMNGAFTYSNIVLLNNKPGDTNFVIFPNPANQYINISAPINAGKTIIEMYDAIGRRVFLQAMTSSTMEINTARFSEGTYIVKILNNNSQTAQKVVIMH